MSGAPYDSQQNGPGGGNIPPPPGMVRCRVYVDHKCVG